MDNSPTNFFLSLNENSCRFRISLLSEREEASSVSKKVMYDNYITVIEDNVSRKMVNDDSISELVR